VFLVGGFIAYNIIVVAYAASKSDMTFKMVTVAKYAPWLLYLGLVSFK
jgi:hypothetical protein